MKHGAPRFARSILLIAIMAMIGQAMAACCRGLQLPVAVDAAAVTEDGSSDCYSQSGSHHDGDAAKELPLTDHDCDTDHWSCDQDTMSALDTNKFKFRTQLNYDIQFNGDVLPFKGSIDPPQTAELNWTLLSDFRKSHQSTPYYISYCSFLE